jgi:acyl carrier protein
VSTEESVIRRLLAEVCALDESVLRADVPLLEYGLDSARGIDLLVGLEDHFDIRIPDDDVPKMRTLADVTAYVTARVAAR